MWTRLLRQLFELACSHLAISTLLNLYFSKWVAVSFIFGCYEPELALFLAICSHLVEFKLRDCPQEGPTSGTGLGLFMCNCMSGCLVPSTGVNCDWSPVQRYF